MLQIAQYNNNLGIALLIVGGAGTGKTSLGLQLFNGVYVFVADPNLKSGLDYMRQIKRLDNIVGFNSAYQKEDGTPIAANLRYEYMLTCLNSVRSKPEVGAIFLDSAAFIEDILKARICGAAVDAAIKLSGYEQWGQLMVLWKSLIHELRQFGKPIIMSAHEWKEKDDSDGIWKYSIAVDGQIRERFPAIFSDVIRTELSDPKAGEDPVWMVRPISNPRQEHLKNTYGLKKPISADEFVKLVQSKTLAHAKPEVTAVTTVTPK